MIEEILLYLSCLATVSVATLDETNEGLLVLARAGGRYDPLQLWYGECKKLWGVNQCILDETDSFRNHSIKGNFRSPRIDNLTDYGYVELDIVVMDQNGIEALHVHNCQLNDNNRTLECDDVEYGKIHGEALDGLGGLVLRKSDDSTELLVVYNGQYYGQSREVTILLGSPLKRLWRMQTGYKGCFDIRPTGIIRAMLNQPTSLDNCFLSCPYFVRIKNQTCACFHPSEKNRMHALPEQECNYGCSHSMFRCGGNRTMSVYESKVFTRFDSSSAPPSPLRYEFAESLEVNDSTDFYLKFEFANFLTEVMVTEEEECVLTSALFNVTSHAYDLVFNNRTVRVQPAKHPQKLPYIWAKSVLIRPIVANNCTHVSTRFTFTGLKPLKDYVNLRRSYVAFRGKWFDEKPSTDESVESTMANRYENGTTTSFLTMSVDPTVTSPNVTESSENQTTTSGDVSVMTTSNTPTTAPTEDSTESSSAMDTTTSVPQMTTSGVELLGTTADTNGSAPLVQTACTCLCKMKRKVNVTKAMVAKEKAIKIQKKLKVNTQNLSSRVRKKGSAHDTRVTAAVGGYLGICLLTIALGSLILADITSITRHIRLASGVTRKPMPVPRRTPK